jgi:hypothetical protein
MFEFKSELIVWFIYSASSILYFIKLLFNYLHWNNYYMNLAISQKEERTLYESSTERNG